MSRECRNNNCNRNGGKCELIACRRQLAAAKEAIREAEEILEGKHCGERFENEENDKCPSGELRECEFKLRIANKKIIKSANVLNEYIDEYIKDDCDCCCDCCCNCCCTCCPFDTSCRNFYDNPCRYNKI